MADLFSADRASAVVRKDSADTRNEFDKDFDRILFSAPIRRLADKTQVFPLETNDSVRTRLTHSHEVSNLCRSLALQILRGAGAGKPFGKGQGVETVPVIAASAGLAHDVGNPPFGHQGENAIRDWFTKNEALFQVGETNKLSLVQQLDLKHWEGNAQTFRLMTRLQVSKGGCGLNLTNATLGALMKYTVDSSRMRKKEHPAEKKFGFFDDDRASAEKTLTALGLKSGQRHPVAYVMEACDDIAYSTVDIEDSISKGLVSLSDVLVLLRKLGDKISLAVCAGVEDVIRELEGRPDQEVHDIALQYFRSLAIAEMVVAARTVYLANQKEILAGDFRSNILDASEARQMGKGLQDFALKNAFQSPRVTELELRGANILHQLMTYFWRGISECSLRPKDNTLETLAAALGSPVSSMFGRFVYAMISSNYRTAFESLISEKTPVAEARYRQLLLLGDMVSGMTEDFVIETHRKLRELDDANERAPQS
jgi:dGTPase